MTSYDHSSRKEYIKITVTEKFCISILLINCTIIITLCISLFHNIQPPHLTDVFPIKSRKVSNINVMLTNFALNSLKNTMLSYTLLLREIVISVTCKEYIIMNLLWLLNDIQLDFTKLKRLYKNQ